MTDKAISPLRRRMVEDMTVRGFTACTQRGYLRAVRDFTVFFGRSPDQASAEDLRRFQVHMRTQGGSATTMNAAVSALRFFFGVTLGRGDASVGMTTVRQPRRLSVILSPEEVARVLDAAPGLPGHQNFFLFLTLMSFLGLIAVIALAALNRRLAAPAV